MEYQGERRRKHGKEAPEDYSHVLRRITIKLGRQLAGTNASMISSTMSTASTGQLNDEHTQNLLATLGLLPEPSNMLSAQIPFDVFQGTEAEMALWQFTNFEGLQNSSLTEFFDPRATSQM